jgi:hypothetical protein
VYKDQIGDKVSNKTVNEVVNEDDLLVNLSPRAAVDNVANWPLSRVINHLKTKEKEDQQPVQPYRMSCRSTIKLLVDVIDELSSSNGVSRNKLCRWLSYHGIAIANDDAVIARLSKAQSVVRRACLVDDDTNTMDAMNSLTPYSPMVVDESRVHLYLYDAWVASDFDDIARVCGVHKYRAVQIFLVKSILSDETNRFEGTASRLAAELSRWDTWMAVRLAALEALAEKKR